MGAAIWNAKRCTSEMMSTFKHNYSNIKESDKAEFCCS